MTASISKTNNGVKLIALVAVLAMVFTCTAIVTSDDGVDAADNTTYLGGVITSADGLSLDSGTNIEVIRNTTIPSGVELVIGGNLKVPSEYSITVEAGGSLIFESTSNIDLAGKLIATGAGATINNATQFNHDEGKGLIVTGSITVTKGATLVNYSSDTGNTGNGEIVLKSGAILDVNSVSKSSTIRSQNVLVYEGATFDLDGYAKNVTVEAIGDATYYTAGAMFVNAESLDNIASNNRNTTDLVFTVTNQTVSAYTTNNSEDSTPVTVRQYILNVDGAVDGYETTTKGAFIDVTLQINAGKSMIKNDGSYTPQPYYIIDADATTGTALPAKSSITGTLDVTVNGKITVSEKAYVLVSGAADVDYTATGNGVTEAGADSVTISGYVYVTGTIEMDDANIASLDKGTLYIDGGKVSIYNPEADLFTGGKGAIGMYGAYYLNGDRTNPAAIICDFDVAVTEAIAADVREVEVMGLYDATARDTADEAIANGAYVIDTNITIPEGMEITYRNKVVILPSVTVTFADGSDAASFGGSQGIIYVDGKLVDQSGTFDFDGVNDVVKYEVRIDSEDDTVSTYTTLAIAISEATAGDVINLNGLVVVDENLTIPADVTVVADATQSSGSIKIMDGAVLTINGTIDMNGTPFMIDNNTSNKADGSIVLNNVIVSSDDVTVTGAANYTIAGAYYTADIEAYEEMGTYFITSVAVAGTNSQYVDATITIKGTSVPMGDVTFTEGENSTGLSVIIVADKATAGTVTLVGADFKLAKTDAEFTGTITTEATAGTVSVVLDKANGFDFLVVPYDDGTSISYTVEISGDSAVKSNISAGNLGETEQFNGDMTIAAGTVTLNKTLAIDSKASITVADGATLVIGEKGKLYAGSEFKWNMFTDLSKFPYDIDTQIEDVSSVIVDGTLTVKGAINWGPAVINGTMNVEKNATVTLDGLDIHGTLNIADDAGDVTPTVLVVEGAINGEITGLIMGFAYTGADLSAAVINDNGEGVTGADSTTFYVNGVEFITIYAGAVEIPIEILAIYADIPGTMADTSAFYEDEAENDLIIDLDTTENTGFASKIETYFSGLISYLSSQGRAPEAILSEVVIGDLENIYVNMDASYAKGTISQGTGLTLYIDNVALSSFEPQGAGIYNLTVGTHTVSFDVKAGYDGTNATITFNGQTIENDGTITITPDMKDFTLVASGAVPATSVSGGSSSGSDDGMGLTDYLLIILVILIVVMAIMVAMRLMRS